MKLRPGIERAVGQELDGIERQDKELLLQGIAKVRVDVASRPWVEREPVDLRTHGVVERARKDRDIYERSLPYARFDPAGDRRRRENIVNTKANPERLNAPRSDMPAAEWRRNSSNP